MLGLALVSLNLLHLIRCVPISPPRQVIIDVDGGADDIFALSLAFLNPNLVNVVAITTVFGNTNTSQCVNNVLRTLQVFNRGDVPVYVGSSRGMVYTGLSDNFFGHDGLGDNQWNESLYLNPESTHAAIFLADFVSQRPGEIVVVATGALTNIALAQHLNPSFLRDVAQLYVMGGAYQGRGNVRPGVEFNFYVDPLAAAFVLLEAYNNTLITLLPLETSPKLPMDWRINELGTIRSPYIEFLNKVERKILSRQLWGPNDQLMVSIAMNNKLENMSFYADGSVLSEGGDAKGALLINYKSSRCNLKIITHVDQACFQNFVLNSFSAGAPSYPVKGQFLVIYVICWISISMTKKNLEEKYNIY